MLDFINLVHLRVSLPSRGSVFSNFVYPRPDVLLQKITGVDRPESSLRGSAV
jgi:hypothetical protein